MESQEDVFPVAAELVADVEQVAHGIVLGAGDLGQGMQEDVIDAPGDDISEGLQGQRGG